MLMKGLHLNMLWPLCPELRRQKPHNALRVLPGRDKDFSGLNLAGETGQEMGKREKRH